MADIAERDQGLAEYMKKALREHLPACGVFELTARCNLDCKMCYVHKTDASEVRERELSTKEWEAIFDSAISSGMKRALLTGGECLLRPDFNELYLYLHDRGVAVDVNTNGLLLTEEKVELFDERRPHRLQISIYGSNNERYERVTGHRAFDRIIRSLDLLEAHNIKPVIALTVSRYMSDDLILLVQLITKRKLRYKINFSLIESREDRDIDDYTLGIEDKIKLQKILNALSGKIIKKTSCPALPAGCPAGTSEPIKYGMPCNAGNIAFSVTWEGKMALCLSFPEICADIRKEGFDACWRYIRETADKVVQPPDCAGCAYVARCPVCPAQRYNGLFSGQCRTEQCGETVKRYEAGLFSLAEPDNNNYQNDYDSDPFDI